MMYIIVIFYNSNDGYIKQTFATDKNLTIPEWHNVLNLDNCNVVRINRYTEK